MTSRWYVLIELHIHLTGRSGHCKKVALNLA